MTAEYRMVHFVPDPFLGGRVPVAAVIRHKGQLLVERVPHLPGAECLGRASAVTAMRLVLQDLGRIDQFDRLPKSVGPLATLSDARPIPAGVEDPVEWVRHTLAGVRDRRVGAPRSRERQRVKLGAQFLRTWAVDKFVQVKYRPQGRWQPDAALGPIAQFVEGRSELMLLEPLAPTRPTWQADLIQVTERYAAYKYALEKERMPIPPRFYAYILAGGAKDQRQEIAGRLQGVTDDVVDTESLTATPGFIERIRQVGMREQAPLGL